MFLLISKHGFTEQGINRSITKFINTITKLYNIGKFLMDIGTLFALVISGLGVLYSIFRDNTKDTTDLLSRVSYLETTIAVQDSNI